MGVIQDEVSDDPGFHSGREYVLIPLDEHGLGIEPIQRINPSYDMPEERLIQGVRTVHGTIYEWYVLHDAMNDPAIYLQAGFKVRDQGSFAYSVFKEFAMLPPVPRELINKISETELLTLLNANQKRLILELKDQNLRLSKENKSLKNLIETAREAKA